MGVRKEKKYVTIRDIVIPAGTVLTEHCKTSTFVSTHHSAIIGFGSDDYVDFIIDEDSILKFSNYFTELNRDTIDEPEHSN